MDLKIIDEIDRTANAMQWECQKWRDDLISDEQLKEHCEKGIEKLQAILEKL